MKPIKETKAIRGLHGLAKAGFISEIGITGVGFKRRLRIAETAWGDVITANVRIKYFIQFLV